jgi:hypothetical protein
MKFVHKSCLAHWQSQLRIQKGWVAAKRCDVCKCFWKAPFGNETSKKGLGGAIAFLLTGLQPRLTLAFQGWKALVLAQGLLSGIEAGAAGFRLGMRHQRNMAVMQQTQRDFAVLMHWAPFSVWVAGSIPCLNSYAFMWFLATCGWLGALRGSMFAAAGCYAGAVSGFLRSIAATTITTFHIANRASSAMVGALAAIVGCGFRFVAQVLLSRR